MAKQAKHVAKHVDEQVTAFGNRPLDQGTTATAGRPAHIAAASSQRSPTPRRTSAPSFVVPVPCATCPLGYLCGP